MLLIQDFIKNKSLKELKEIHGVKASFSKTGHKASFNYDQIESKENDLLAQECRGLILSRPDGKSLLSEAEFLNGKYNFENIIFGESIILNFPMKRFFNYGQDNKINLNDKNLEFFEKLDGTLCMLYFDPFIKDWCVATRSSPDADIPLDNNLFTFRTLFEKCLQENINISFSEYTSKLNKNINYFFELTSTYNRIVVNYTKNSLTLLAARSIFNGKDNGEIDISKIDIFGLDKVKKYKLSTVKDVFSFLERTSPLETEGFVLKDSNFNRIKIKSPQYILAHKSRDSFAASERNCIEAILLEKEDDFLQFLPDEICENIKSLKNGLKNTIHHYDMMMSTLKNNENFNDRKWFAKEVSKIDIWSAPLFQIYDNKCLNFKDFIDKNKKNNTWSVSFLDKILDLCKNY